MSRRVSRRGLLAAGASLLAGGAVEAQETAQADAITAADIAEAAKLSGLSYSEKERAGMVRSVAQMRGSIRVLRAAGEESGEEPAVHFDPRLPGMQVPSGKPSFTLSRAPLPKYDGKPESLAFASAADLSRLLRARKVTSVELTRMYLDRLKRFGPRLICVVTLTEELAMRQAERADRELAAGKYRGPLHGIPWGAKDLLATKGIRTTWGAKPYENQVFDYDATVVKRLDEAGAVLVAKLSMGELAQGDVWYAGMTRNPWRPTLGSSGSSAGPGSATAAGLVGFSIGTETLGSIVSPSTVNGVTGLRPTYGRVPRTGAMALCWTMDKIGPMCRGVEDCAMVLNAIYGPDGEDPTTADIPFRWNPGASLSDLRIGIDRSAFDAVMRSEQRKPIYQAVLDTLAKLGVKPIPITLPAQTDAYRAIANLTIGVESAASFAKLTATGQLDLLARQEAWPLTFRVGSTVPAADYLQAMRMRTKLQREMAAAMNDIDLYVTLPFGGPSLAYTNLTGHPTCVTRCGMLNGLPQMVEFIGQLYREDAILRVARAYEQATPFHTQWPDTEKIPPLDNPTR